MERITKIQAMLPQNNKIMERFQFYRMMKTYIVLKLKLTRKQQRIIIKKTPKNARVTNSYLNKIPNFTKKLKRAVKGTNLVKNSPSKMKENNKLWKKNKTNFTNTCGEMKTRHLKIKNLKFHSLPKKDH